MFNKYLIIFFNLITILGSCLVLGSDFSEISGSWKGKIVVPGFKPSIVFHISSDNKQLKATLDSPDQFAHGIPVTTVKFLKHTLYLEVESLNGRFEGTLEDGGRFLRGTWTQNGQSFPLDMKRLKLERKAFSLEEQNQLVGFWEGLLNTPTGKLRIQFHIKTSPDNTLSGTMNSPDQGATGIALTEIDKTNNTVKFLLNPTTGFEGELKEDGTLVGKWLQGSAELPLALNKKNKLSKLQRPQTPKRPFPYHEENVILQNPIDKIQLGGTLTLPGKKGIFSAAILITGSGAQDRDESLFGHKPFLVLSDFLTRQGIAVLRLDDRGIGQSTGSIATSTTIDFVEDIRSGVNYLKKHPQIDPKNIGLIGHSEGGIIAPILETTSTDIAFIVMLAGTGLPGEEILYLQGEALHKAMNMDEEFIETHRLMQSNIFEIVKSQIPESEKMVRCQEALNKLSQEQKSILGLDEETINGQCAVVSSKWLHFFLTYDPRPTLEKVTCPVLALIGEKDLQVPAKENLWAIENALSRGGNNHFEVRELAGLNHLFQTAETGSTTEYAQIEETMSPVVLRTISEWILKIVQK